jgi:hypothetical protein
MNDLLAALADGYIPWFHIVFAAIGIVQARTSA